MKKSYKVLLACAIPLAIIFHSFIILCICYGFKWSREWHPSAQENTVWKTEDNRVSFSVGETGFPIYGTIQSESGEIDIELLTKSLITKIYICSADNLVDIENGNPVDYLETWRIKTIRKNKFVATVEETTYFEVGEKITFYKVE